MTTRGLIMAVSLPFTAPSRQTGANDGDDGAVAASLPAGGVSWMALNQRVNSKKLFLHSETARNAAFTASCATTERQHPGPRRVVRCNTIEHEIHYISIKDIQHAA